MVDRTRRPHRGSCTWLSICRRFCEKGQNVGTYEQRLWVGRWLAVVVSSARQPFGSVQSLSWGSLRVGWSQNVTLALGLHIRHNVPLHLKKKAEANGIDLSVKWQAEKSANANMAAVGRERLALQERKLAPATYAKAVWTLETLVFPYIGGRPIANLGATHVLKVLKHIEGRGTHETAHRTCQRCSQVFRYASRTERAGHDVTADLRGALAPVVSDHHAAITEPNRMIPSAASGS